MEALHLAPLSRAKPANTETGFPVDPQGSSLNISPHQIAGIA